MTTTPTVPTVLLLGATGRTGGRVLTTLLQRGVPVRAVVRSAARLPQECLGDPLLTVVEAEVLTTAEADLAAMLEGCDVVISCLGHPLSVRGILGPPWRLVEGSVRRVCETAIAAQRTSPLRVVLMSSVSVNRPGHGDTRRGAFERALLAIMRAVLPPARDNQRAADLLTHVIGEKHPTVSWVVVRPDTLREGGVTPYVVSSELTATILRPDETSMANVAAFMADLACDPITWDRWAGQLPVITNDPTAPAGVSPSGPTTAA